MSTLQTKEETETGKEPGFTPGPWQQKHDFDLDGQMTIIGNVDGPDDGRFHYTEICDVNEDPDECFANARLITAAPDLHAALVNIVGHSGYSADGVSDDYEFMVIVKAKDYRAARAALAKAKSVSP